MKFEVNFDAIRSLVEAVRSAGANADNLVNVAIRSSALKVQELARQKAPHKTGTLQRSIQPEFGNLYGEVKVNEKYGIFLEEGTDPFIMYPRNKKALFWPGALHPVKSVRNPGIKARPFFQPAIEEAQPHITAQFQAVSDTLVRGISERIRT